MKPLDVSFFTYKAFAGFDVGPKWLGDEDSKGFFYSMPCFSDGIETLDIPSGKLT